MSRVVPSEAGDKKADREGADHSPHREDGHGERPQSCQSAPSDGLREPVAPRLIVEILNDLKHKTGRSDPLISDLCFHLIDCLLLSLGPNFIELLTYLLTSCG